MLRDRTRLYSVAAELSALLLGIAIFDHNDFHAARVHCVEARALAEEIGYGELHMWVDGTHEGPDEAVEQGKQAFVQPRFLGVLLARARELDTVLMTRYPKEDCVTKFHQQYEQVRGQELVRWLGERVLN